MTTDRWVNSPEYLSEYDRDASPMADPSGVVHAARTWRAGDVIRRHADCGIEHGPRGSTLTPVVASRDVTCMTCIVYGARMNP